MGKIVGVDIGSSSVKLVYFSGKTLKKAITADLPDDMVAGGRILSKDAMADFLRETAKSSGIPLCGAAIALPSGEVLSRELTMPAMTEQQLRYNLPYEFHDFLDEEKSKYFFDYSVRAIHKDEEGFPRELDIYACALRKQDVEDYRAMFRRAGFKLKVLTPVECAYANLVGPYLHRIGNEQQDCCVINLGHSMTQMYMFRGPFTTGQREIDLGLSELDRLIAEHCAVDIHVAREYKKDNFGGVLDSDYAREFYSRLAVEIMKAVNFYHYNNRERELQALFLCGGGSVIAPLRQAIADMTKLRIHPAEELLADDLRTENAWRYLRAIGGVSEGIRGGLA